MFRMTIKKGYKSMICTELMVCVERDGIAVQATITPIKHILQDMGRLYVQDFPECISAGRKGVLTYRLICVVPSKIFKKANLK